MATKNITNATQVVAEAIATFAEDLKCASCMGTRKDAVQFLANKIGKDDANKIAEVFGLTNSFYKV